MMGGLDWAALDTVVNVIGVTDVEALLVRLVTIRDFKNDNRD